MEQLQTWLEQPIVLSLIKIVAIALVSWLFYRILEFFITRFARRVTSRTPTDIDDRILELVEKSIARIVLIVALYFIGEQLKVFVGEKVFTYFEELLFVVIVYIVTGLTLRIITLLTDWYLRRTAQRTGTEIDREFGPLLNRLIQIVLVVTALLIIFDHFGIDAKGLVATLGVGSLAIAFAAQDTLANMIAGFVIMFDRPFRVGDRIKTADGTVGEVFEIGLRTVKLLDFEKNLHIIPNQEIGKSTVINYSYPQPLVRVRIDVGVAYGTDLDKAKKIILEIYKNHPEILDDPEPNAFFVNFGDSSLDLMGIGFVEHYSRAWPVGEEIRMQVYKAFAENGIEIPFPQRVVHLHQEKA